MGWCGLFIYLGGGFLFLILTPTWGNDRIWLVFSKLGWNHHLVTYIFLPYKRCYFQTHRIHGCLVYLPTFLWCFIYLYIYFHGSVNIPIIPWIPSWEIAASTTTTEASLFELLSAERFSKRHGSGGSGGTKVATNLKVATWWNRWMEPPVGESGTPKAGSFFVGREIPPNCRDFPGWWSMIYMYIYIYFAVL